MKYLVVGLGNIGEEYRNTRHNIGFDILDALAGASNILFKDQRYGAYAELKHRGRTYCLLKPATYMNRSGNAVRYYLQQLKLPEDRMMVIADDIALPLGTIRIRAKGGNAGHNGLGHIQEILGSQNYPRLRFGIGSEFGRGQQVDYVLGKWAEEETSELPALIKKAGDAILSFGVLGVERTMNQFNTKGIK